MKNLMLIALVLLGQLLITLPVEAQYRKSSWVRPYSTRSGKYVSGHVRKGYSTDPGAYRKRAYNRAYYQRNKWRYRSRRN